MNDEIDHAPALREPEGPGRRVGLLLGLVGAALLAGGLGILGVRWLRSGATAPAAATRVAPEADEGAAPAVNPSVAVAKAGASPPDPTLPALDESDAAVRALLAPLAAGPAWTAWIGGEALLRRFAAAVLAVDEGRPAKPLLELIPSRGSFRVRRVAGGPVLDDANGERFEAVLATLESIDLVAAARVWRLLRPLAETAWREIAPAERSLDDALRPALDHLIATPAPSAPLALVEESGTYRFADPELEGQSPSRKLLLRLGTERRERLRAWLRTVRDLL